VIPQLDNEFREGGGVIGGVIVGVGANVHEHDLAGPQAGHDPADDHIRADVTRIAFQPRVSTVHRMDTKPAWFAIAIVRASAAPYGNLNSGAGLTPVTACIWLAPPPVSARTAESVSFVRSGWVMV
jgi:hypothetical protein